MEHKIEFNAGYDCIKFKCKFSSKTCLPNKGGSHGRHGLEIKFLSIGDAGAVQFVIYTGWLPHHVKKDDIGYRSILKWGMTDVMPADLGYHSIKPVYEGQDIVSDSCPYIDNKPCYYDGSGLNASDAMYSLVNGGQDALWTFLDAYYECVFNKGNYPESAEYPMAKR